MAVSRLHTWIAGEVLLASDLNSEFNNVLTNGTAVAFPATSAVSMGGFALNFDAANTMSLVYSTKGLNLSSTTAINDVFTTVVSATTPDIWTAVGGVVNYTGTTTATGFAAAPQTGARRTLVCSGAAPFTAGANVLIDGYASGSTYTAAAGDRIHIIAVTTTQFRLTSDPQTATQIQNAAPTTLSSVAGTNTITATAAPVPSAYASGQSFEFVPAATNTGATTINISSLGAKNVFQDAAACVGGELKISVPVRVKYDGTQFNILGERSRGLVLVGSAGPASASATLDVTTGITSAYDEYELHYVGLQPGTNANQLIFRVSQDGGSTFKATNEYVWCSNETDSAPANTVSAAVATQAIALSNSGAVSNAAANTISGVIRFWRPSSTTLSKPFEFKSTYLNAAAAILHSITGSGFYNGDTAAFNAVRVLFTAGTITIGSIYLYGVRKS